MGFNERVVIRRVMRLNVLMLILCLVGYGLFFEEHAVTSLIGGETTHISGPDYILGTTFDQFARYGKSLVAPLAGAPTQAKDCKT